MRGQKRGGVETEKIAKERRRRKENENREMRTKKSERKEKGVSKSLEGWRFKRKLTNKVNLSSLRSLSASQSLFKQTASLLLSPVVLLC